MKNVQQGQGQHWDPVCGKELGTPDGRPTAEYKKRRYFFCSERCRHTFEQQAERFRLNELARVGALLTPGRVRWGIS